MAGKDAEPDWGGTTVPHVSQPCGGGGSCGEAEANGAPGARGAMPGAAPHEAVG